MLCTLIVCITGLSVVATDAQAQGSLAEAYRAVRPALVFIQTDQGTGSGFIVSTTNVASFVVTDHHVVSGAHKISVYINGDYRNPLEGHVVKSDTRNDLAVLRIGRGELSTVTLGAAPPEGSAIGIAGYPPESLAFLKASDELTPQLGSGIVTAIRNGGSIIQHTAASEKGDSGGPVFTVSPLEVVGVTRGKLSGTSAYLATAATAVQTLLTSADVAFSGSPALLAGVRRNAAVTAPSSMIMRDAPGAHAICLLTSGQGNWKQSVPNGSTIPSTDSVIAAPVERASGDLQTLFGDVRFEQKNAGPFKTVADMLANMPNGSCAVGITFFYSYGTGSGGFSNEVSTAVSMGVVDYRGDLWFKQVKSNDRKRFFVYSGDDVAKDLSDLTDQLVAQFASALRARGDGAADNFLRYGFPIGRSVRYAFFGLTAKPDGSVHATDVLPIGTASRAGLQNDDVIVSVNGAPVAGMTPDALAALAGDQRVSDYDVLVQQGDGRDVHVRFSPEDLRWYVEHAPTGNR